MLRQDLKHLWKCLHIINLIICRFVKFTGLVVELHSYETPNHSEEESDGHDDENNLRQLEAIPDDQHPRQVSVIISDVIGLQRVLFNELLESHLDVIVLNVVDHG